MKNSMLLSRKRLFCLALLALSAIGLESAAGAPTGPSPKLVSAKALDADRDGSIDGFELTFSSVVKGKGTSKAPFSARVGGYVVTRQAPAKGRTVRVTVAELSGCDVGARPRISVKGSTLKGSGGKPIRSSATLAGKPARGAPQIVCAVTSDADRDGHLDGVALTYSKKIRNRAKSAGRLPFEVDRYSVSSVSKARGRNLALGLREKAEFDTDALPAVIYRAPRTKTDRRYAVSAGRSKARSTTFNATRDRAAARLLSTRTLDGDTDGLLDGVEAKFSEPVRAAAGAVTVDGATVTGVSAGERQTIVARMREGNMDSGARPNVVLGAGDTLRDPAGNPTGRLGARSEDGAPPVVVGARTADRGGAVARLDGLDLTFSEPVTHPADSDGTYPLSVGGYGLSSVGAADGPRIGVSVNEGSSPDGGSRPSVGYTRGAGAAVRDLAGNEAAANSFEGPADGIAPVLLGAATLDTDVDGLVDGVRFDFSEPVSHSARPCPGCAFSLEGFSAQFAGAGSGSSVTVTVAESGGNGLPTATYAGGAVTDFAGNPAPGRSLSTADASPPVVLGARTVDADGDARIDRLDITFSEPIAHGQDATAPYSLAVAGYTVSGVSGASGRELSVSLQEKPVPDTGAAPAVSYTGAGGERVTDLNGTEHAVRGYPGMTRDDVAPQFLEARTADSEPADGNGKLDSVELLFSEEVVGDGRPAPYSVSGRTIASVTYLSDRVRVGFDGEASSFDTDAQPSAAYSASGDLRDVPEGPGDAASPAPSASVQALDGAGPVVVGALTADADTDGKLDGLSVTLSEPVQYTPGAPAIALSQPELTITRLTQSGASLTAEVAERPGQAEGNLFPQITVTDPDRIRDLAATPNPARDGAFSGALDGVRPIPVGARTGEENGAACATGVEDGRVDCLSVSWSEPVSQPGSAGVFTATPDPPLSVISAALAPSTDLRVTEGTSPNRDRPGGSVSYTGGGGVADIAGNAALATAGPLDLAPACSDPGHENNETRSSSNFQLSGDSGTLERLCAADDDWFRVAADNDGEIKALVDPDTAISPTIEIVDSSDGVLYTASPGAGTSVQAAKAGLAPSAIYWLHLSAPSPQEGNYCVDVTPQPGESCDDGDPNPQ